jgi:hypothetical protein
VQHNLPRRPACFPRSLTPTSTPPQQPLLPAKGLKQPSSSSGSLKLKLQLNLRAQRASKRGRRDARRAALHRQSRRLRRRCDPPSISSHRRPDRLVRAAVACAGEPCGPVHRVEFATVARCACACVLVLPQTDRVGVIISWLPFRQVHAAQSLSPGLTYFSRLLPSASLLIVFKQTKTLSCCSQSDKDR